MKRKVRVEKLLLQERIDSFKELCYKNNLRITPQRLAIYKEVILSREHPSACMIYEKIKKIFPHISFDTVNRTLLTFNEIGAIFLVEGSGDPKRFDADFSPHHHFRCLKCNVIVDFYNQALSSIDVPAEFKKDFIIYNKVVHLEGVCPKCNKRSANAERNKFKKQSIN
jgi:Fur family peroxide stress response transcriptional regulator